MKVTETKIPGVIIIEPDVFGDHRGYFMETYSTKKYEEIGITTTFVQDNMSFSAQKGLGKNGLKCLQLLSLSGKGRCIFTLFYLYLSVFSQCPR